MNTEINTQVVVIGAGPAGYSAAFRCADLGLKTVLVERYNNIGGVCLNVGCIPSKTLLHMVKVIQESKALAEHGIFFSDPTIDINKICFWKKQVITQLTNGLYSMAKSRNINICHGIGKFIGTNTLEVKNKNDLISINFDNAIIATGSSPIRPDFLVPYNDSRIWNSTDALELKAIPNHLLIIGGGIIGLEIGTIYHTLGSKIDMIEIFDQIIPAADKDIIKFFTKTINNKFNLMLNTKVVNIETQRDGIYVSIERENNHLQRERYDAILVAVGRTPNSANLDVCKIGIKIDDSGFILVNNQLRTSISHIFAIGDIIGHPMLAHKGIYEGRIAAEIISGMDHYFDTKLIPSIAYTIPEIAWVGLTEKEAEKKNISFETAIFPWTASGRAITSDCAYGLTKLIFDKNTRRIIGGAIVGNNGGELLGEISLAIEMGCDAEDIALTIHAHPTLYESIGLAAEIFEGNITDMLNTKGMKNDCI